MPPVPKPIPPAGTVVPAEIAGLLARTIDTARHVQANAVGAYHGMRAEAADGFPLRSETGGGGMGYGDPTGNAVAVNTGHLGHDQLRSVLIRAAGLLETADQVARYWQARAPLTELAPRCTGGMGQPGALYWGRPDCLRNALTKDGLCDPCRQRRDHWRRMTELRTDCRS